jgi:hypothetical protein
MLVHIQGVSKLLGKTSGYSPHIKQGEIFISMYILKSVVCLSPTELSDN